MAYTVAEIARLVGGQVDGRGDVEITGVAGIREARPGDLTFLANRRYDRYVESTQASAIIMAERNGPIQPAVIVSSQPYLAFLRAVELFVPRERRLPGIHPRAIVGRNVRLGQDISIGPNVVIEEDVEIGDRVTLRAGVYVGSRCSIGSDTLVYPNVTILKGTRIGERVVIHSGTVIGSDGFGFAKDGKRYQKIPQVGNVAIEDDVEIGSNVSIDRATTGVTFVGRGTKIDNLVQIAHNVVIGENSIVVAQVGISGSTELGRGVTLAGQAGLIGHLKIGDNVKVGAQAGVIKSIPPDTEVSGYPARPHKEALRLLASQQRLPRLIRQVEELEERLAALEGREKR
jgi:UDP-3-O-[3-hydroxymyristoyl] glucosamine N-acyltransferase